MATNPEINSEVASWVSTRRFFGEQLSSCPKRRVILDQITQLTRQFYGVTEELARLTTSRQPGFRDRYLQAEALRVELDAAWMNYCAHFQAHRCRFLGHAIQRRSKVLALVDRAKRNTIPSTPTENLQIAR